jgi:alpha-beta hydrolase superfamily lysophospholipase
MLKLLLAAFLFTSPSHAWYEAFDQHFTARIKGTDIAVATLGDPEAPRTLVYLHGFADTADNHAPLLHAFAAAGYHVITFDYPGHGLSGGEIRWWGLSDLADLVPEVLAEPRAHYAPGSPVVLAGWSTGATIALRVAQAWAPEVIPEGAKLAGVIAFAPALPARVVIHVNASDLTSGDMKHAPRPVAVPVLGNFAASITLESRLASAEGVPADVPTLILAGGDSEDLFANTAGTLKWVRAAAPNVVGYQCAGAKHGIEFEPRSGGAAQALAVEFAGSLGKAFAAESELCGRIRK